MEKLARVDYKAPGGKLLRITIERSGQIIRRAEITGDFFLIPEDGLPRLEQALAGTIIEDESVRDVVDRFFENTGIQSLGVTREDFVKAILSTREVQS